MKKLVFLAVLLSVLVPSTVLAIDEPDSGPFILQVDAYRHLRETDDILLVGRYNIPYTVPPSETAQEAFFFRLLDGAEELDSVSVYSYDTDGYGYGSFALYVAASEATWEDTYTVQLLGNPLLSWVDDAPLVNTSTIEWHASGNQAVSQVLLYTNLISWANSLATYWDEALISNTSAGTKLATKGADYFLGVIPSLPNMCPQLFSSSVTTPEYTDQTWTEAGSDAMLDSWPFDFGGLSAYFGMPEDDEIFRTVIAFIMVLVVGALMIRQGIQPQLSLFACFGLLFVLAVMGMISMVIVGGIAFIVVLLTGMVFLLRLT